MTDSGIFLGRIWGIPIRLHLSWFVIFLLVTWSLAAGYFPQEYPQLTSGLYWLLGALTSLLFAASVLAHELGHAYLALRNKVPVRGVTLFIFGGVAQIGKEPETAGAEFRIAIAGPLTSLGLAALFGGLWLLDQSFPALAAPSAWLARINFLLAAFNMIPGFPLDGGRVLRAVVWRITGDMQRATRIASFSGQLVAFGFIGFGVFTLFSGNFFNGLWLVFIGWFLQNAAASSYAQSSMQQSLRGVTVAQVMNSHIERVPWNTRLDRLVEERVLHGGNRLFLVTDQTGEFLRGMLTLRHVTDVPRDRWEEVLVDEVMIPRKDMITVEPDIMLLDALRIMDDRNVAQVPVMKEEQVDGFLCRDHVLHYVRLRAEAGL